MLDPSQVLKALQGLCDIADYENRALVLLSLARRGARQERTRLQNAALDALWAVRHHQMAKFSFEKLLPSLRDEAAARALELSKELGTKGPFSSDRGLMIKGLAHRLPPAFLGAPLEAAIALPEEMDRAEAVTSLIHRLDGQARKRAIRVAFQAIEKLEAASRHHANALRDLAPWLDSTAARRAWRFLLRKERSLDQISGAFPSLAERFDQQTAKEALKVVLRVRDRFDRVASLVNLAKKLAEPDRSRALHAAAKGVFSQEGSNELDVENCAIVLAPFLTGRNRDRVLRRGFERATSIGNDEMCAEALSKMLPLLDGKDRQAAMETGFRACFHMKRRAKAARLIDSFLRAGDDRFRAWALNEARGIGNALYRLEVLAGIAKRTERPEALVAETRELLVHELSSLRRIRRKIILCVFSNPALFAQPVLSRDEITALANDILDICAWRWD